MLDVEKALKELQEKSMADIERATALTWGARAVASYRLAKESKSAIARFQHFYEAENYRQEALEHAAMAEDGGDLLRLLYDEIEQVRAEVLKAERELSRRT